ncbi:MAG: hypothetical protein A3J09_00035 [Candidatus Zambryskibacteria bacterium RIFCSPLOWO2_02_FULL_51_21]|uniref:Uncharacterized protein n=1 Tax=Candidatus Zambryskibacteria bacterium RIFCSPHIGHO2_02_FULL_43_37 TaxID=1802749 RepID=A0A1G2TJI8_9BACT|nr:MAG: hypothetical protein A2723_00035 [Candidatus Zambryskibacteria bacterium RIFCSPHIGHO2_01_FULL_52_18]OHA96849.1 MAG: hypothetical protein A3D49_01935 [Candidatus Zambryskibacteria bacterium RIFCSPHIGHO2_02_FULL_43_37]OHB07092.1 MAG: hypothetical protein A2944_02425 [Candidatus Zambryskibacteria bacterium RIFCSPLOWO2_01_FULL_52_12]OHB10961.1 MAG: hypothetical protein A3J09_00035 [Candidatus Zambryskibacteria bacterium RIFCSPLOWO2_02_FULL_51_21]
MNQNKFSILNFQAILILFLLPVSMSAATTVIEIDTDRETVNAVEGVVELPSGIRIDEIYTGNSAVTLWIVEPAWDRAAGRIKFAGLTPGGFRGKYPLFSFSGEFSATDSASIAFRNITALRADGSGTAAPVRLRAVPGEVAEDATPPEPFDILISKTPETFAGKYFASFVAQDKGTGVENYEYALTWILSPGEGDWQSAVSPLILEDKALFKRIYVRATDKAGNFREISTHGPYWYPILLISSIIIVCVLLLLRRSFYPRS